MSQIQEIEIDGATLSAAHIPTENANIVLIQAAKGFVACAYFDVATAEKLNEAVGIVTGVATPQDVLEAKLIRVSPAAEKLGVTLGMTGREALAKMS